MKAGISFQSNKEEDSLNAMRPNKDHEYLVKLQGYYAQHYIVPGYATIASLLGMRSIAAAFGLVQRLKEKGYLASAPCRRLKPGRKFFATAYEWRAGTTMRPVCTGVAFQHSSQSA